MAASRIAVVDGRRISYADLRNGNEAFTAEELAAAAANSDITLAYAALHTARDQASVTGNSRLRKIASAFINAHGVSEPSLLAFPLRSAEQIEVLRGGWASLTLSWHLGRFEHNPPTCRVLDALVAEPGSACRPYAADVGVTVPYGLNDIRFYSHEAALTGGPRLCSNGVRVNLETVKSIPDAFQPNNVMSCGIVAALRTKYARQEHMKLRAIVEVLSMNWTGSVAELEATAETMLGEDVR